MEYGLFDFASHRDGFWFRIKGYGMVFGKRSKHTVMFSERYGYRRFFYLGPIVMAILRP